MTGLFSFPVAVAGALVLAAAGVGHATNPAPLGSVLPLSIKRADLLGRLFGLMEVTLGVGAIASLISGRFHVSQLVSGGLYCAFALLLLIRLRYLPGLPCGCHQGDTPSWAAVLRAAVFATALLSTVPSTGAGLIMPAATVLYVAAIGLAVLAWVLPHALTLGYE